MSAPTSPYIIEVNGVPMAFPADHTLSEIEQIAALYRQQKCASCNGNFTVIGPFLRGGRSA